MVFWAARLAERLRKNRSTSEWSKVIRSLSKTATSPSRVKVFGFSPPSLDQFRDAACMVPAVAADELDGATSLDSHHSIAVNLFLVYPTVVMERAGKQRRVHQGRY